jgi:hypothetical protein
MIKARLIQAEHVHETFYTVRVLLSMCKTNNANVCKNAEKKRVWQHQQVNLAKQLRNSSTFPFFHCLQSRFFFFYVSWRHSVPDTCRVAWQEKQVEIGTWRHASRSGVHLQVTGLSRAKRPQLVSEALRKRK